VRGPIGHPSGRVRIVPLGQVLVDRVWILLGLPGGILCVFGGGCVHGLCCGQVLWGSRCVLLNGLPSLPCWKGLHFGWGECINSV